MKCENAYIPEGECVIFCKKSPKPEKHDTAGRMHALCAFQRFCPNVRTCVMLPGWEKCRRRAEGREESARSAEPKPNRRKKNRAAESK